MLFLTRQKTPGKNEIHIGPNIVIRIMSLSAGQVHLGIEAPKDVVIVRGELLERPDAPEFRPMRGSCDTQDGGKNG